MPCPGHTATPPTCDSTSRPGSRIDPPPVWETAHGGSFRACRFTQDLSEVGSCVQSNWEKQRPKSALWQIRLTAAGAGDVPGHPPRARPARAPLMSVGSNGHPASLSEPPPSYPLERWPNGALTAPSPQLPWRLRRPLAAGWGSLDAHPLVAEAAGVAAADAVSAAIIAAAAGFAVDDYDRYIYLDLVSLSPQYRCRRCGS